MLLLLLRMFRAPNCCFCCSIALVADCDHGMNRGGAPARHLCSH
jgi:hypothetical protein